MTTFLIEPVVIYLLFVVSLTLMIQLILIVHRLTYPNKSFKRRLRHFWLVYRESVVIVSIMLLMGLLIITLKYFL